MYQRTLPLSKHSLILLAAVIVIVLPIVAYGCEIPFIILTKSGPATIQAGQTITYTLQLSDPTPDSAVRWLRITDPIPAGLTFVPGQSSSLCRQNGNSIDCCDMYQSIYGPYCNLPQVTTGECWNCILWFNQVRNYTIAFQVPADTACGTVYQNQATIIVPYVGVPTPGLPNGRPLFFQPNTNPNPNSNVVTTTVVCQSSSSSSSIPSSSSSSSSSSTPASSSSSSTPSSSSSSSTPASSSSSSTPSASSSSAAPIVVIPGNSFSNSNAFASNLSNNQNTQNVSIFNAGANISVGAPNINVNTGAANVAVNATASPSTSVVNNTQGAAQYQPQYPPYPQYPSYPPPPPVYPAQQPPQQIIIEKPVVISPPPIIVQPLPQTGIGDFTGSVEDTRRFLSPITGSSGGGLIATAIVSLAVLLGMICAAGKFTKNLFI